MLWLVHGLAGLSDVRHTVYSLVKDWSTSWNPVAQFFYILLLVVGVSVLAYFTTRLVASAKFGRGGRRNLEILESISVGPQSFVHVLRVGGQFVLVGVTRGQVNMLAQLDADQLQLPEPVQRPSFEALFSRFQKGGDEDPPDNGSDNNP
jgi:flagellar biogenesis protein FliO